MIADAAKRQSEEQRKKSLGVQHWINDLPWEKALERLESQPTVNIEGLVGGYTGPGGKTILPHQTAAKLDLRLVPGMKATEASSMLISTRWPLRLRSRSNSAPSTARHRRTPDPAATALPTRCSRSSKSCDYAELFAGTSGAAAAHDLAEHGRSG